MAWDCEARRVLLVSQFTDLSEMRRLEQRLQCGHPKVHAGAGERVGSEQPYTTQSLRGRDAAERP